MYELFNNNQTIDRNIEILGFSDGLHISAARTNVNYESFIRKAPINSCICCHRFLFDNQVYTLSENKTGDLLRALGITCNSDLCKTCYSYLRQAKMPMLCSKLNGLQIDTIPELLSSLSSLGKNLAKIQICMPMIILPGGQYAGKGLVLNLPRNTFSVVNELNRLDNINNMCLIKFDAGNAIGSLCSLYVNPQMIISAFRELNQNNCLYSKISLYGL